MANKYVVWVRHATGYASREEEANSPEEARAAVQAHIDNGLEKQLSLKELLMLGPTGYEVVGVQDYDESQHYNSCEEVEAALGLTNERV